MFRTQAEYHAFAQKRLNENAAEADRRAGENAFEALIVALEDGMRSAMESHPDCFSAFRPINVRDAARAAAAQIARR